VPGIVTASRLVQSLFRTPQLAAPFEPGDVESGYYNDLRAKAAAHGSSQEALAALRSMTSDRRLANAVSIAQVGLGAWQLSVADSAWLAVVDGSSRWLAENLDSEGRLTYLFAMPHTYILEPPWYSAMAQGEAASLLVRAARALGSPDLLDAAARAVGPLLDNRAGLVSMTSEGPVLQEYATDPPAHVLNGWIWALWGLYDAAVSLAGEGSPSLRSAGAEAQRSFDLGAAALAARLPLYDTPRNWSRYDLFPHRIVHVSSPFYHRLHIEQLRAMSRLRPEHAMYKEAADRWAAGAHAAVSIGYGVVRKVAFRVLQPRRAIR
jgi:heparosan-N-sulfate-glucuronate 5-epimerase